MLVRTKSRKLPHAPAIVESLERKTLCTADGLTVPANGALGSVNTTTQGGVTYYWANMTVTSGGSTGYYAAYFDQATGGKIIEFARLDGPKGPSNPPPCPVPTDLPPLPPSGPTVPALTVPSGDTAGGQYVYVNGYTRYYYQDFTHTNADNTTETYRAWYTDNTYSSIYAMGLLG